jgi:NAD(P)-dependent dehydrogenase (short-subunit alcohol dehydrogenase family)
MKKVVLVTGASSGIGFTVAEKFIKEGHTVYGFARRVELMKPLEALGGHMMYGDVRDEELIRKIVNEVIEKEGRIDVLVNNAAYAQYGPVEDVTIEAAKAQLDTNVFGYVRLIKAVLPHMREKKSGIIINISSAAGKANVPFMTWYGASKHALEGLLDAFRIEAGLSGVKVVIIEPGFIHTDIYRVAWEFLSKVKISPVYEKMGIVFKKQVSGLDQKSPGPLVIANKVYQVVTSVNLKARYAVPMDSKIFIFLKKILSDRVFDWLIKKQM